MCVCCCHYSFEFLQIAVCQLRHVLITIFGFVSQKIAMSSNVPKNFYCQELTYPWWSEIWWVSVLYESSNLIWDPLLKCLGSLFCFIWSSSSSSVCRVSIFGLPIDTSGLGQNFNLNFIRLRSRKPENLKWSPFSIKRALAATARPLPHLCPYGQGHGLLQVLLKQYLKLSCQEVF